MYTINKSFMYQNSINKLDVPLSIEEQFKKVQHLKTEIKTAYPGSTKNRIVNYNTLTQTMRYRYIYKWHY